VGELAIVTEGPADGDGSGATAGRAWESVQALTGQGNPWSDRPVCEHPQVNECSRLERGMSLEPSWGDLLGYTWV